MRTGRNWTTLVALVAAIALLATPGVEAKKGDNGKGGKVNPYKLMLKDKLPEVTAEELAMTGVPYAPGAPAAILLDAEQQEFYKRVTEVAEVRTLRFRRVKLFDDAAGEDWGQFTRRYGPDTKIESVTARTTLPDGTEIDASDNVQIDETRNGGKLISVSFPRAQKGAVLDVMAITRVEAGVLISRWQLQHEIPVLDSRMIFSPPNDLQFTLGASNIQDRALMEPHEVKSSKGRSFVWHFTDMQAIPDEPNQPPTIDTAKALYVIPTAWHGRGYHIDFASDWEKWNRRNAERYKLWVDGTKMQTRQIARSAIEAAGSLRERVDAIRRAALDRVRLEYFSDRPLHNGPDAVLAAGSGASADIALLNVAMLQEVGIDAHVVAFRHRDMGQIPDGFPVEYLLNDFLVRVQQDGEEWLYSPAARLPIGLLPEFATGVIAMPVDKVSTTPMRLPEASAGQSSVNCLANLELSADGRLSGTTIQAYRGVAAERWRRMLRFASEDERNDLVQRDLAVWMTGVNLDALEIENLDDDGATLTFRTTLSVDGYVTAAGSKLLINPMVFSRIRPDDWAATSRLTPIDLGGPIDVSEVVNIKLPENATAVEAPSGAKLDAGAVGSYQLTYQSNNAYLSAKRKLRMNQYRFPAAAWTDLAALFRDMAMNDDTPAVVSIGAP